MLNTCPSGSTAHGCQAMANTTWTQQTRWSRSDTSRRGIHLGGQNSSPAEIQHAWLLPDGTVLKYAHDREDRNVLHRLNVEHSFLSALEHHKRIDRYLGKQEHWNHS
ncbi:hypothetical protein BDU57DRAFT_513095 [Ampelomyces quisqualis]|uniref:Uncharacterized protein n=1 Tax=Ampelomyces quisqualis TaxID=50730 RepID=A0A6A5R132_AMPQU|nr:hypothetical protein BDU57DRAFT_513095 [Ampelomyces quisqualis]